MASLSAPLSTICEVLAPGPNADPQALLSRWSDTLVSLPSVVLAPCTIDEISAIVEYAACNNLKLIPAGGGRACFVPINREVLYVDMKHFNSFELDEEKGEVRFGGGCLSGPLLKGLAARGYYTAAPNSNGVGMTGAVLGGLAHPLAGLHGMGIDMVRSFTIVPFRARDDGKFGPITVTRESTGEERKLFDALRGAGHGLGVIVSTTLEVHPLAKLNLDHGDKVWQRSLVFAPDALETAVHTYLALQSSVPPEMNFFLGFMRAPPTAPRPGAPVILLSISFFGPSADADATSLTFSPSVLSRTLSATTLLTPFGDIHNALDPANRPGGLKELHGAFVHSITASSIHRAFASFMAFTESHPSHLASSIILAASNTTKSQALSGGGGYYNARDRGVYVQVKTAYAEVEEKGVADAFAREVHAAAREEDRRNGRRDWAFANNFVEGGDIRDVYTEEQIREIGRLRRFWDAANVGWAPVSKENGK